MSIADSVRGLSDESAAEFLRNRRLPEKVFTTTFPPLSRQEEWLKRRFMDSKRISRQQDEIEDLSWFIPDIGGNW